MLLGNLTLCLSQVAAIVDFQPEEVEEEEKFRPCGIVLDVDVTLRILLPNRVNGSSSRADRGNVGVA